MGSEAINSWPSPLVNKNLPIPCLSWLWTGFSDPGWGDRWKCFLPGPPELPKPSRTIGKKQKTWVLEPVNFEKVSGQILIFLTDPFWGGAYCVSVFLPFTAALRYSFLPGPTQPTCLRIGERSSAPLRKDSEHLELSLYTGVVRVTRLKSIGKYSKN